MILSPDDILRLRMQADAAAIRAQWELAEMIDAPPDNCRKADDDLFSAMWCAGVSREEIAGHFGMSRTTVSNTRNRLGLPKRDQVHTVPSTKLAAFWAARGEE